MSWIKIFLIAVCVLVLGGAGIVWYLLNVAELDPYVALYVDNCGQCHGNELEGTGKGVPLIGTDLRGGDSVTALQESLKSAHISDQPIFASNLSDVEIKGLAIYIGERRMGQHFTQFQFDRDIDIPHSVQNSEEHNFVIETVIDGLDPLIFSIEPLPDGSLLVTEKERGLSIVSPEGIQSELIEGTPLTGGSIDVMGVQYGTGWLLDVAIHPDYENNGWIYLHYTDLCRELSHRSPQRSV